MGRGSIGHIVRAPIQKTLFILRYLQSEEYRRRINRQLNRGESLHALRCRIFLAEEGRIRRRHHDEQVNQATCLTLVTNAAILWNTVYLEAAIERARSESLEPGEVPGAGLHRQLGMLEETDILGGVPRRQPDVVFTGEQQHRLPRPFC